MPTLYHHPMSSASRFVRLILTEYGYQADLIEEQTWEKRRDFLDAQSGGHACRSTSMTVCARSAAPAIISEYLDETHGVLKRDRRLLAEDPFQRAEIRRLTEWFLHKMEHGRDEAPGPRARLQAADDGGPGRRRARFEDPAHRAQPISAST